MIEELLKYVIGDRFEAKLVNELDCVDDEIEIVTDKLAKSAMVKPFDAELVIRLSNTLTKLFEEKKRLSDLRDKYEGAKEEVESLEEKLEEAKKKLFIIESSIDKE